MTTVVPSSPGHRRAAGSGDGGDEGSRYILRVVRRSVRDPHTGQLLGEGFLIQYADAPSASRARRGLGRSWEVYLLRISRFRTTSMKVIIYATRAQKAFFITACGKCYFRAWLAILKSTFRTFIENYLLSSQLKFAEIYFKSLYLAFYTSIGKSKKRSLCRRTHIINLRKPLRLILHFLPILHDAKLKGSRVLSQDIRSFYAAVDLPDNINWVDVEVEPAYIKFLQAISLFMVAIETSNIAFHKQITKRAEFARAWRTILGVCVNGSTHSARRILVAQATTGSTGCWLTRTAVAGTRGTKCHELRTPDKMIDESRTGLRWFFLNILKLTHGRGSIQLDYLAILVVDLTFVGTLCHEPGTRVESAIVEQLHALESMTNPIRSVRHPWRPPFGDKNNVGLSNVSVSKFKTISFCTRAMARASQKVQAGSHNRLGRKSRSIIKYEHGHYTLKNFASNIKKFINNIKRCTIILIINDLNLAEYSIMTLTVSPRQQCLFTLLAEPFKEIDEASNDALATIPRLCTANTQQALRLLARPLSIPRRFSFHGKMNERQQSSLSPLMTIEPAESLHDNKPISDTASNKPIQHRRPCQTQEIIEINDEDDDDDDEVQFVEMPQDVVELSSDEEMSLQDYNDNRTQRTLETVISQNMTNKSQDPIEDSLFCSLVISEVTSLSKEDFEAAGDIPIAKMQYNTYPEVHHSQDRNKQRIIVDDPESMSLPSPDTKQRRMKLVASACNMLLSKSADTNEHRRTISTNSSKNFDSGNPPSPTDSEMTTDATMVCDNNENQQNYRKKEIKREDIRKSVFVGVGDDDYIDSDTNFTHFDKLACDPKSDDNEKSENKIDARKDQASLQSNDSNKNPVENSNDEIIPSNNDESSLCDSRGSFKAPNRIYIEETSMIVSGDTVLHWSSNGKPWDTSEQILINQSSKNDVSTIAHDAANSSSFSVASTQHLVITEIYEQHQCSVRDDENMHESDNLTLGGNATIDSSMVHTRTASQVSDDILVRNNESCEIRCDLNVSDYCTKSEQAAKRQPEILRRDATTLIVAEQKIDRKKLSVTDARTRSMCRKNRHDERKNVSSHIKSNASVSNGPITNSSTNSSPALSTTSTKTNESRILPRASPMSNNVSRESTTLTTSPCTSSTILSTTNSQVFIWNKLWTFRFFIIKIYTNSSKSKYNSVFCALRISTALQLAYREFEILLRRPIGEQNFECVYATYTDAARSPTIIYTALSNFDDRPCDHKNSIARPYEKGVDFFSNSILRKKCLQLIDTISTTRIIERAKARREKLNTQLANTGHDVSKRPLREANILSQAPEDKASELSSPIHKNEEKFAVEEVKPGNKYKPARLQRLAALATDINSWEDDLSHPTIEAQGFTRSLHNSRIVYDYNKSCSQESKNSSSQQRSPVRSPVKSPVKSQFLRNQPSTSSYSRIDEKPAVNSKRASTSPVKSKTPEKQLTKPQTSGSSSPASGKTPKKTKHENKLVMPNLHSPAGASATRTTSFSLAGYMIFSLTEVQRHQFTLNK
ncbi:unnamed protein product, partial [Trichogramma brassicae]